RVLQDLAQPPVGEGALHHALQRAPEQEGGPGQLAQITPGQECAEVREIGVEEPVDRDTGGACGGVEMAGER
ncbi:hypothetical protein ABE10_10455, partial [Bacillus toyonensis]|nr:hypothetical protein [Bacillus toyonensis]